MRIWTPRLLLLGHQQLQNPELLFFCLDLLPWKTRPWSLQLSGEDQVKGRQKHRAQNPNHRGLAASAAAAAAAAAAVGVGVMENWTPPASCQEGSESPRLAESREGAPPQPRVGQQHVGLALQGWHLAPSSFPKGRAGNLVHEPSRRAGGGSPSQSPGGGRHHGSLGGKKNSRTHEEASRVPGEARGPWSPRCQLEGKVGCTLREQESSRALGQEAPPHVAW